MEGNSKELNQPPQASQHSCKHLAACSSWSGGGSITMATTIYEDMEDGDYGTFLGEKAPRSAAPAINSSPRKWFVLAMLSVLTALNQGICYSYAPIASIVEGRWESRVHSTELITVYFISYIPCSFIGSWIMDKKGLRYGVLLGGFLQTLGAFVRYFACLFSPQTEAILTLFGQIIASVAMPFMVNSPPVLSANWFPPSMRSTSTAVAVNANALGTAVVYLTAPFIVHCSEEVPAWNLYVALLALIAWLLACACFQSFPRTNNDDTESIVSDVQLRDEYDWGQWANAFSHKGFWITVFAFSVAECVLNAMCALLGKFLSVEHFTKPHIGLVGAAFIVSSLIGGQIISQYVDKRRNHKTALQLCLLLTAFCMATFRLVPKEHIHATLVSLLFLGAVLGPLQPIVLELGVECAFPTSEATVAALQQLCGNFLSALVVPGLSAFRRMNIDSTGHVPAKYFYASPEWNMVFLLAATFVVFCFYNGEYKRHNHETKAIYGSAPKLQGKTIVGANSWGTGSFF